MKKYEKKLPLLKKIDGIWFVRITKEGTYQDLRSWINQHAVLFPTILYLITMIILHIKEEF